MIKISINQKSATNTFLYENRKSIGNTTPYG